ncbi:MAG: hypothetical protein LC102_05295 [Ignavibacteriales bacterium]|nr:MAG: beta-galactosidase [Ignavibacteriaceae bacterium]MBW7873181.1 beta-galactosidase [Ignavibacteria bacterium]MCZ2142823.1 hypothetical protein [Ignavibacteriales bacterium]OQY79374.1 MAG: hypothetical protein B6D45_00825 [Ignavibacteriales bacterium UTCHB3]MBV6443917.1 Beta-galactosidase [Ignavibacteriaceae bacterium]
MKTVNLNGQWQFLPDPDSEFNIKSATEVLMKGFISASGVSVVSGSSAEEKVSAVSEVSGRTGSEGSFAEIPSNWELHGLKNFNGTVWYAREVEIPPLQDNEEVFFIFNGVDYISDLFLNGVKLGSNEGYFAPFIHRAVSGALRVGKNLLVLRVNSPFEEPGTVWPLRKKTIKGVLNHHDCRPGGWDLERGQDCNTGGIWNSVKMVITSGAIAENVKITYEFLSGGAANVIVFATLLKSQNNLGFENVRAEITAPDKRKFIFGNTVRSESGVVEVSLCALLEGIELWYPWDVGEQKLYELTLFWEQDEIYRGKFGLRSLELESDGRFFINDKELFLRGTNIIPEQLLSTLSRERIAKMVQMMREAHINSVRVHAHVTRPEFYEACDEAGILVWQDFPLQWTHDDSPEFKDNAVRQIKKMVRHLYNHPSVAVWCCHNEPGEQVETLDVALEKAVRSEDHYRIVRRASNYEEHAYDGWYWGDYRHYAGAPMGPLVTEFGAQALPGVDSLQGFLLSIAPPYDWDEWRYHNFQPDQTFNIARVDKGANLKEFSENSQKYQADLLSFAVHNYRRRKGRGITGVFQFMFIDCWQAITWSVIDYFGVPKLGYHALQQAYDPLLLSVFYRQNRYFRRSMLNFEIWVINDLYESFSECRIELLLNDTVLVEIKDFDVEENSNLHFGQDYFNKTEIPLNTPLGAATFEVHLYSKDQLLRHQTFPAEIVELE